VRKLPGICISITLKSFQLTKIICIFIARRI
jgi:hypothetical protein